MKNEDSYFNFPVCLLSGFLDNHFQVLSDILYYSIYAHSTTLNYSQIDQRFAYSAESLNVNLSGQIYPKRKRGRELYESIPNNVPRTGISKDLFWDFYTQDKTDFDKVCLLAYLALKSIIGAKTYAKIGNKILFARMDGKTSSISNFNELSITLQKYTTRHYIEKIKHELRLCYEMSYYAYYTRGFYFSFKLDLEGLIKVAEKKRKSNQLKELKKQETELRKRYTP